MTTDTQRPLEPGDAAPDFDLPAVHKEGSISLADYRGRSPVLLAIFRGLYCPFCRRAIAQFGTMRDKLLKTGIESLVIVATDLENARLYFKYRPVKVPVVADPDLVIHRAYRLPQLPMNEQAMKAIENLKINPTGELPEPMPVIAAAAALDKLHGYEKNAIDKRDMERQGVLLKGEFLLDAAGIVRWVNIECAKEGMPGFGKFPTEEELLGAARALA